MNYEHLKTFMVVVNHRSFSKTAKDLHLSQPTVTAHIKALESELNTSLFERTTKKVELTAAASILYRYAKDIVRLSEMAESDIHALNQEVSGKLNIACSLTTGEYILPLALRKLRDRYPQLHLNVGIHNTTEILAQIKAMTLDVGLIEAPVTDPQVETFPFMDDELVIIGTPEFFKNHEMKSIRDLLLVPLILREQGSGTRSVLEHHLESAGILPADLNIVLELGSTASIKAAVESDLGISIISKTAIQKEITLGLIQYVTFNDVKLSRQLYIIYHHNKVLKPTIQAFIQAIKDI